MTRGWLWALTEIETRLEAAERAIRSIARRIDQDQE